MVGLGVLVGFGVFVGAGVGVGLGVGVKSGVGVGTGVGPNCTTQELPITPSPSREMSWITCSVCSSKK